MSTLTIPLSLMRDIAALLLPHASNDDVTPVITTAALQQQDDKLFIVATDRYSVARYDLTGAAEVTLEGDPFLIPRDALTWIVRQLVKGNLLVERAINQLPAQGGYRLEIHQHFPSDERSPFVRVTLLRGAEDFLAPAFEQLREFGGVKGNYPPVARLFTEERTEVAHVTLGAAQMEKVLRNARHFGGRNAPIRWSFTSTDNKNKPGPIYVSLDPRFDLMVQPNLELR